MQAPQLQQTSLRFLARALSASAVQFSPSGGSRPLTEGFVMAFDDCYAVLGVPRDANLSQVRRAYRNLCHHLDPDHGDESSAAMFRDVIEAFDTLCDAGARADHQREIARREMAGDVPGMRPKQLSPPRDLFEDFEDYRPSREALLRAFVDNVLDRLRKSRPVHPIRVEVAIAQPAPNTTGVIPFKIPAAQACPMCEGSGRTGVFTCDACGGEGVRWATWRVDVPVPAAAMTPGASIPVSLAPVGVTTLFLDVTVRSSAPI
jgi:DnaJ-class molecular chaperone